MAARSRRQGSRSRDLDADIDFANLENIDDGPSELGQRRLTELSGRVIEAARGSWFAWLVCAVLGALGIIGTTLLFVARVWPVEDELAKAQAEVAAVKQENDRLKEELAGVKSGFEAAKAVADGERARAEAEQQKKNEEPAAAPLTKKLPRKKRGGKKR